MINIFKSMMRKKLVLCLTVIQLSIGLYMINMSSSVIIDKQIKLKNFTKLFNYKNTYVMKQMNDDENRNNFKDYRDLNELENTFNSLKEKGLIKNSKVFFSFPCKIDGLDENCREDYKKLSNSSQMKQYYNLTSKILVNKDFVDNYNIKIKYGRNLKSEDFDLDYTHEEIPILIGLDYKGKVNVGDIFNKTALKLDSNSFKFITKQVNVKFKVVGIMEKNAIPSLLAKSKFIENVVYSDSLVVIPTVKDVEDFSSGLAINDLGVFIELNDNSNVSIVEDTLNNKIKHTGLYLSSYSLNKDYLDIKANLINDTMNSLVLGGILLIISTIGITSIIIGNLHKRKREFGIRICAGATITDLCEEVFLEILLVNLAALALSYLYLFFNADKKVSVNILNGTQLGINLFLILILVIIISSTPILMIRKMKPVELLKSK